jgi:hypothetical protein
MTDQDPVLAVVVGCVFATLVTVLLIGYMIDKKKHWRQQRLLTILPDNPKEGGNSSTKVVPAKIKMRRKATHDPNDTAPRRIIQRTRVGIDLIFAEFDSSGDGMIDQNEFKALVVTLAARSKVSINVLPNVQELDVIFEALDEDGSGSLSLVEWNHWVLDGLEQAPSERAKIGNGSNLGEKMDMMLVCLEQLANEAGKLLSQVEEREDIPGREIADLPSSSSSLFSGDRKTPEANNGNAKNTFENWE